MDHGVLFRISGPAVFSPAENRPAYWAPLDSMLRLLLGLFATPALLWRDGFSASALMDGFAARLREAEAGARALLWRDAEMLAGRLRPRPSQTRQYVRRARPPQTFTVDFRAWRVGFRTAPKSGKRGRGARTLDSLFFPPDKRAQIPASARGCALRFEALRRVIENPEPFVERLARRLSRRRRKIDGTAIYEHPPRLSAGEAQAPATPNLRRTSEDTS